MTPQQFIDKWEASELKESSASQEHFIDLCRLLDEPTPAEADPKGDFYTFERGVTKTGGGEGWADVWKRGHFGWEYKGKKKDLEAAYAQLLRYSVSLESPPLLITCDTEKCVVRTNWTNTVQDVYEIGLRDLLDAGKRQILKRAFSDPESLKPKKTRQTLTEEAAATFAELAKQLRERGFEPHRVAHFVNRLVFCMFAEDIDLLPGKLFEKAVRVSERDPYKLTGHLSRLFAAMKSGGEFGLEEIPWFNGGLFDDDDSIPLNKADVRLLLRAAELHWSDIDPSVLGTLFERGLDPDKRSQLGAHYTDRDKIMLVLNPAVIEPLTREWEEVLGKIEKLMNQAYDADECIAAIRAEAAKFLIRHGDSDAGAEKARQKEITRHRTRKTNAEKQAAAAHQAFIDRLVAFRILDPACGSGNFLNLALQALKNLEHRANLDIEAFGLPRPNPRVGPECVKGIEINPYAAELARVSIWIGEIQWMKRNGFSESRDPILRPLNNIECRDALIERDPATGKWREAEWPEADVIVGNPPFLGGKLMRSLLGHDQVDALFDAYRGRVRPEADLVCYWVAKGGEAIVASHAQRVGFVTTNSIRGGANREVLKCALDGARLFFGWADEPWVVDGAAVRVSMIGMEALDGMTPAILDGKAASQIHSDLTAPTSVDGPDLTRAARLKENADVAFMGDTKGGAFDIPGDLARQWLKLPINPNDRTNSDVLKPWINGSDIVRRPRDMWIIDFGWTMTEQEAALYEVPFAYLQEHVWPVRRQNNRKAYAAYWWRHVEARQGMWRRLSQIRRAIVTPCVSKFRAFAWCDTSVCPDHAAIAIARDDNTTFGILHSRFHELWSLRMGTWLGVGNDPRYTPTTTFETFPFPEDLTPDIPAQDYASDPRAIRIAEAVKRLNDLRENWLNPPDLVRREPEVVSGYPDRILPISDAAAKELKKRTLTNLYNARPAWLDHAHRALDEAVAAAYGWPTDLTDDEILARLFALNQERAAK